MQAMTKEEIDYEELNFEVECPTCEQYTTFTYKGQQNFPDAVAEKLGLPTAIHLWSCNNCNSTISHVDLGIEL